MEEQISEIQARYESPSGIDFDNSSIVLKQGNDTEVLGFLTDDGEAVQTLQLSDSLPMTREENEDTYYVIIEVRDHAGDVTYDTPTFFLDVDMEGPDVRELRVEEDPLRLWGRVEVTDDFDKVQIYEGDTDDIDFEVARPLFDDIEIDDAGVFEQELGGLDEGSYDFFARALNTFGFDGDIQTVEDVTVDNTPPRVEIESPGDGRTFRADRSDTGNVKVRARDTLSDVAEVAILLDGASIGLAEQVDGDFWEYGIDLDRFPEGEYELSARATDDPGNTATSEPVQIRIQEGNTAHVSILEPDGDVNPLRGTEIDVTMEVRDQQEVALWVEIDGEDSGVVERSGPDEPGGEIYSFNNVSMPLSAETVEIWGVGYDRFYETTDSSDEVLLERTRHYVADEHEDERADAMAEEEDFGVVTFGEMGGSNTDGSDPAFDPSSGEELRFIPDETNSPRMRVFTTSGEKIFSTSGSRGELIAWDGETDSGDTVKNGVYIVRISSGNEVKSFPVMVIK